MKQNNESTLQTILIVDDNKKNLQVLGNVLHEEGYKIAVAQDGYQAVKLAEKIIPGLILLDIMMPGIDGLEVLNRLKKSQKTQNIPVIMLTAKDEDESKVRALGSFCDDYIVKPVENVVLRGKIHKVLSITK